MIQVRTSTTLFSATRTSLSLRCFAVFSLSCPRYVHFRRPIVTVWSTVSSRLYCIIHE